MLRTARDLGRPDVFEQIEPNDLASRTGSKLHIGGIFERRNGNVHPAKLALGLGSLAKRLGVQLFEYSHVERIENGPPARIKVGLASVTAKKLVIATNAWARQIPEIQRRLICVTSAIVATKPIPERLAQIGWTGRESITDSQSTLNYYRTTQSGRIVFGKGWAELQYGMKVSDGMFRDTDGIAGAKADFNRTYPTLVDVPIEFGWSGPIDRTGDGLPIIGNLRGCPHIIFGVGWSGNGVGPSRIGGRILASLALEVKDRWTQNAFVGRRGMIFPPEPIRYVFGSMIRNAVLRKDVADIAGQRPSRLDRALARLAPAGTEDKGEYLSEAANEQLSKNPWSGEGHWSRIVF